MRCHAFGAAAVAVLALGCATLGARQTVEWPAVVVDRFRDLRASSSEGPMSLHRCVVFHTADKELVLEVDAATYERLPVGSRVTLLVRVNKRGEAIGGDTLIRFDNGKPPARGEEKGTDA